MSATSSFAGILASPSAVRLPFATAIKDHLNGIDEHRTLVDRRHRRRPAVWTQQDLRLDVRRCARHQVLQERHAGGRTRREARTKRKAGTRRARKPDRSINAAGTGFFKGGRQGVMPRAMPDYRVKG